MFCPFSLPPYEGGSELVHLPRRGFLLFQSFPYRIAPSIFFRIHLRDLISSISSKWKRASF
ncbi:unnamed protein product [Meloidogyne enterolobii]|uniref:Uncharacterized protein n=1 Tax=Meloidogyne enterolobii TaxID=390850 RepID=A0ACB0XVQ7_MELEN